MGIGNDVVATFMAIVATVTASVQFDRRLPLASSARSVASEEQVFDAIKTAVERTELATQFVQATVRPSTSMTVLALRDGLGQIRAVTLLSAEVPRVLRIARAAGVLLSPAAGGIQMLEFALNFADVEFYNGVSEMAFRYSKAERDRAKRGDSSSGNSASRRALKALEDGTY